MESLARLGIDLNSLLLYAVNFGLIVLAVWYFFSKPILRILDERRNLIDGNIKEAEKLKAEMIKEREKMADEKKKFEEKLESEMKKLHAELADKRKSQDAELELKRAKMLEEVRAVIDEEKKNLQKGVKKEILALVQKMVLHIVANKVPADVVEMSVSEAWKSYNK